MRLTTFQMYAVLVAGCKTTSGPMTPEAICGNGAYEAGEQCEPKIDGDIACDSDCTWGVGEGCGDGIQQEVEQCDDGNRFNGDGCDTHCRLEHGEAVCGDGRIGPGEACDDGNVSNGDGCTSDCQIEMGHGIGCPSAATLTCEMQAMGTTAGTGSTTLLSSYACAANMALTGNEMIYEFRPTQDRPLQISFDGSAAAVAVVIEDDGTCPPAPPAPCLTSSLQPQPFVARVGHRYLIVVDAPAGQDDQFFLGVRCGPS